CCSYVAACAGQAPSFPTRLSSDAGPPLLPLEADREAVRLVADALQQEERLAAAWQDHGELVVRQPDLFEALGDADERDVVDAELDRKSTRLHSSHVKSSYAGFCLQ